MTDAVDDKINAPKKVEPTPGQGSEALGSDALKPSQPSVPAHLRHTLRTPLNHIIGYSEMLLEEAEERGLAEFASDLQKIRGAGKNLLALISETLAEPSPDGSSAADVEAAGRVKTLLREGVGESDFKSATASDPGRAHVGRILVVDDNESNRDMLSRRLQHEGYDVDMAENGRQAFELLKTGLVDLILLDVMMPEMDGFEVLSQLKANTNWRDIPVIMISAVDEIESVARCIERGAEEYLPKPFNPVLLRARIGACLEKKRLRDQEVLYLKEVARVTAAAGAVEAGMFDSEMLSGVAQRSDELGQLARVFQQMAREIVAREDQLRCQIQVLRIEIDQTKKALQVSEIVDSDYFHELQKKAKALRDRSKG